MAINENEFYRQATLRIFGSLNIETAISNCKEYLDGHIPISGMFFTLYEPSLNTTRVMAGIWPPRSNIPRDTVQMPQGLWETLRNKWQRENEIRIINDRDLEPAPISELIASIFPVETSHLNMDLVLEEKRIGMFHMYADGKNRYGPEHAHLISLLQRPFSIAMANILQHQEIIRLKDVLADDNSYLQQQMVKMSGDTVIGADFGLRNVMEMVHQVAQINSPVLLLGETGVGKEVIANALHFSSKRKSGPFIKVNCGAIPDSLIDSELFGHEKGAFTGAMTRKRGRFERAHGGTIFLDEIGELPPAAQVRLLRVLQHHEIERVGGTEVIQVDVRIISATHRNMEKLVQDGKFREDLWYRLNVFPIMIPPLRRRIEDIPTLVSHFLERKSRELKIGHIPHISESAIGQLQSYHWPGNVRELENLVERVLIRSQAQGAMDIQAFDDLPVWDGITNRRTVDEHSGTIRPLDAIISGHIRRTLDKTDGRVEGPAGAAELLGLHPSTLRGRMKKLGIPFGRKT
jgi:transcriptional regulator with GAF, ATPase, and Fis domain